MKKRNTVGVILVMAVWLALAVGMWLAPGEEFSQSERRKLQQRPALTGQSLLDGRYMSQFESYCQDQFPLREEFRKLKARFSRSITRRLDNNGIYLVGDMVAQLEYPLNQNSVQKAVAKFDWIYQEYLQNCNKVLFSVIPDKGYYLADANGYPSMDYEALFGAFRELNWAQYVDLTPALDATCYYRTDTHWRQELILDAAQLLGEALEIDISGEDYELTALERPFYGVYYGQAALPMEPETMYLLQSDILRSCTVTNFDTGETCAVYDLNKLSSRDQYDVFLSGGVAVLTVENPSATNQRELVIFRDSFGSSLAPLLVPGYAKVTLVDIRYVSADAIGQFVNCDGKDVLFLYSTLVLNQSAVLK